MAKHTLVIDGDNRSQFSLIISNGTVRIGDDPDHIEGVLAGVRILRIHCELELDEEAECVGVTNGHGDESAEAGGSRQVRGGESLRLGSALVELRIEPEAPTLETMSLATEETVVETRALPNANSPKQTPPPVPSGGEPKLSKRLRVVDGADTGRTYPLPQTGAVTIGKSNKHADIALHDLYVSRVHCTLEIEDDLVFVTHVEGDTGTLIDGERIDGTHLLKPSAVLRVGNSHLMLEVGEFATAPPPVPTADDENYSVSHASAKSKPVPSSSARRSSDPLAVLEGQVLGHYRIGVSLGTGQTGTVFHAIDEKTQLPVSMKVFPADFPATAAELERFARVIKSASQVHFAHLTTIHGAGKTGAHCWIAREFVEGESLAIIVDRIHDGEKPSWSRAARVAWHMASALECLHQHHAVHGNITPRNILIAEESNATKLTDLGVTQALAGSRHYERAQAKKLAVEMPYRAPEQTEPDAFVDDLADLYALGAVLYALLTGRPPFGGKSIAEVIDQIRHGKIVKPAQQYKKCPPGFETVVLKLLARHQEDRYQTATALIRDLEPIIEEHGIKV